MAEFCLLITFRSERWPANIPHAVQQFFDLNWLGKSMEPSLLVSVVGVMGALVGSTIGGLVSYLATRSVRRLEWKQGLIEKNLRGREDLYADFLSEASRLMLLSFSKDSKGTEFIEFSKLAALESKVWFHSDTLGKLARQIVRVVLKEFTTGSGVTESEKKADEATFSDLRDKFITECKADLNKVLSDMQ